MFRKLGHNKFQLEIESLKKDLDTACLAISERDSVIVHLQKELNALKDNFSQNENLLNDKINENEILDKQIKEITANYENLVKKNDDLHWRVKYLQIQLDEKTNSLQDAIDTNQKTKEKLEQELTGSKITSSSIQKLYDNVVSQNNELARLIREKTLDNDSLLLKVQYQQAKIDRYEKIINPVEVNEMSIQTEDSQ